MKSQSSSNPSCGVDTVIPGISNSHSMLFTNNCSLLLECQVNPHLLGKDWNSTNYGGWSHKTLVNMQHSTQFQYNLFIHMGSTFSLVRGWKQLFHMFGLTTCLTIFSEFEQKVNCENAVNRSSCLNTRSSMPVESLYLTFSYMGCIYNSKPSNYYC